MASPLSEPRHINPDLIDCPANEVSTPDDIADIHSSHTAPAALEEGCEILLTRAEVLPSGEYYLCLASGQPNEFSSWFVQQGSLAPGAQTSNNANECFTFPAGVNSFFIRQYLSDDTCFLAVSLDTISSCPERLFEIVHQACDTVQIALSYEVGRDENSYYYVDWGDGRYSKSKSDTVTHVYTSCPTSDICVTLSVSQTDAEYFSCCYPLEAYLPSCYCSDVAVSLSSQYCKEGDIIINVPDEMSGLTMKVRIDDLDTLVITGDTALHYVFPELGGYTVCLDYKICDKTYECCKPILLIDDQCNSADFSFSRNETTPSCINPCYTISPYCSASEGNIHVWEMEDSTVFYGSNPPACFLFSDFVNTDGEVCVRHYILYCDSIIADTTKCVPHPNGAWLGRPGETRRLSDSMKNSTWGPTVHDFLVSTQSGPNYPKIDGTLLLDESHLYADGRWYFGNLAKVLNESQYFGLESMQLQSAWRLDVNAFSGCCFWIGIESQGHTFMDWDESIMSDAHFLLHYPARSSSIPPRLELTNNLLHTNIFGIKSIGQNVSVRLFDDNVLIGENAAYSRSIPCGCSAINGIDFRSINAAERVVFPNTGGGENVIQDYEHGFHMENARLEVRNFLLSNLEEMGVPAAPSNAWINSDKRGKGIEYLWTRAAKSSLNIDEIRFLDMDFGVAEHITGGLHELRAKASSRRQSIYFNNVGWGYDIGVSRAGINGLIQGNDLNVDELGVFMYVTGEGNNVFEVTDNNIISDGTQGVAQGVMLSSGWEQSQQFRVRLNDIETAGSSMGNGIRIANTLNSIIEHNRIHPSGANISGISMVMGGHSVIQCNDVEDVDLGIHVRQSRSNEYKGNALEQNRHDLYISGDAMGTGGSVIRWNSMDQSGEESIYYEPGVVTGVQHHNQYNSWTNQNHNEEEAIHWGSGADAQGSQFWAPSSSSPGSLYHPRHDPEQLIVSDGGTYQSPPVDHCLVSTDPDSPVISTPQFIGFAADSIYTALLEDSAALEGLSAAQRLDFDLGLFELILHNPSWKTGNTTLTGYFDSLSIDYVGSSVALKDSIAHFLEEFELQRSGLGLQQAELDSLEAIIDAQYDSLLICSDQLCLDSISVLISALHVQTDSLQGYIDSLFTLNQQMNLATIDSFLLWNSALSDTALYEWSERIVTNISLRWMKGDSLSAQDKLDLQTIASYCDEDAGRSVWQARLLCWMLYAEHYEESQCIQSITLSNFPEVYDKPAVLHLYPNPGRDYFKLIWPEHEDDPQEWDMWVYDLSGRVIHRIPNVTNGANVQTAGWGRGVYVIRVRGEGVVYEARWIHID